MWILSCLIVISVLGGWVYLGKKFGEGSTSLGMLKVLLISLAVVTTCFLTYSLVLVTHSVLTNLLK